MAVRPLVALLSAASILTLCAAAGATEGVHLRVDTAPCATEAELRAELDAVGAFVRAPDDGLGRTFEVRIVRNDEGYDTRLVVTDVAGARRERSISQPACAEAKRSAALLVALALDDVEGTDEPAFTPAPEPQVAWPPPAEAPPGRMPSSRDSGGVAFFGGVGGSQSRASGTMITEGAGAMAVARVFRSLRVGASVAGGGEREEHLGTTSRRVSNGWSLRAGGVAAWGAPWDDSIVGFAGEAGATVGRRTDRTTPRVDMGTSLTCVPDETTTGLGCFDTSRKTERESGFIRPYAAASIVFQVPLRAPVRPLASMTVLGRGGPADTVQAVVSMQLGLVWQAW